MILYTNQEAEPINHSASVNCKRLLLIRSTEELLIKAQSFCVHKPVGSETFVIYYPLKCIYSMSI